MQKYKIMKRFLLLFAFLPLMTFAQLNESFTDGNFTTGPVWSGTTDKYIVNESQQLQLSATEAGTSWLSTPFTASGGNMEWRFWIRLAFSPSGSNFSEVYLAADQADLSAPLNGFYLRFGEAGSNDAIELFRKAGSTSTSICRGTEGLLATSFALFVKVTRTQEGLWSVFSDASGSGIYGLQASGTDSQAIPNGFFGFFGQFTVSNSTKMYYDDIYAGAEIVDNTPPLLLSAAATSDTTIRLVFNEALSSASLSNTQNYSLSGGLGQPAQAIQGTNAAEVLLELAQPLQNGTIYTLSINGLEDLAGNVMATTTVDLSYFVAGRNDVVINEIMADPSPAIGLPEYEFIELYNTTDAIVNLDGFVLHIGSSEKTLSNVQILPKEYLILADEDARPSLEIYGAFYGFDGFQLANSGTMLVLTSAQGLDISSVSYTDGWYADSDKTEGGWTLEQKDPANPCGGAANWAASNDPNGGTPGRLNSIYAPDNSLPKVMAIRLVSGTLLQLWFDQQMEATTLNMTENYLLLPDNQHPVMATGNPAEPNFVEVAFAAPFQQGTLYTLQLSENLVNCAGRPVAAGSTVVFGLPETPEAQDVIINEVLFHPFDGGVDFVELYNRSDKLINLEDLRLGSVRQSIPNPPDTTLKVITSTTTLLQPGQYALLATSATGVTSFYPEAATETFVIMETFPTYSNESGTVLLSHRNGQAIDWMSYTEDMHYPLLNYVDGVSLERIAFDSPSDDPRNWHSASQSTGFATPGYLNSAHLTEAIATDNLVVEPELFSPDGDGFEDVTSIGWLLDAAGYTLNIHIFSSGGQHQRHLVKSELVSPEGAVSWNGLDDNGNKVATGIYVVYAEAFNPEGKVQAWKKAVVVATR